MSILFRQILSRVKYFVIAVFLITAASSCNTGKYLTQEQKLIKKTKIVFKNKKKVKDQDALKEELMTFITVEPNHKILLFIPREYLYLANSDSTNIKWYNKALRNLGEKPVLFDKNKAKEIVKNMENYLRFKKGYYDARVDYFIDDQQRGWTNSYRTEIWDITYLTFVVAPGERYKIKNLTYESEDENILNFINSNQGNALIKPGDYIDYNAFELEKSRLTVELQNNGYINFSNNFFEISGDSSYTTKEVDIFIEIQQPGAGRTHLQYRTGEVNVYTDYHREQELNALVVDSLANINYYRQSHKFIVKKELLNKSIFFRHDELLKRDDRQKTFRKLNGLGTYRFVTINSTFDKSNDSIMNVDILLTPYPKKWIWDGGLQGYFSTLGAARLFGISVSSQFINRNMFGGSERYTLRAEAGTELGFGGGGGLVKRTTNLSVHNNLSIPSFQDFLRFGSLANKLGIIKNKFYKNFVEESSTNISLGYSGNNIIDLYSVRSLNASFGYDYTSPKNNKYIFRPLGFNLDLYEIFDIERFAYNPLIRLSFQDNLGTGFLFRDFTHIYNSPKTRKGFSILLINNLEVSGWEVHLLNKLYDKISGSDKVWDLDKISFSKYARYEFDLRLNKDFSKTSVFVSRINIGAVVPFGENKSVPFIRQFGVGGPNSLRAWNIKQLGPGAFRDPLEKLTSADIIYTNQGDFKLELNAEYRFKIGYFVDGALFADAGNVWLLRRDSERPEAQLLNDFLNQMAVGVGYGIRFNFNFFVIRFDFGYKIRNPFKDEYTGRSWYTLSEIRQQGLGNVQVAVNYPF